MKVLKAGLVQVCIEMRDARDVRVRLVENIVQEWKGTAQRCSYVLGAAATCLLPMCYGVTMRPYTYHHGELREPTPSSE